MNFRQWCSTNGLYAKKGKKATHVLMDGGILFVSPEHEDEFAQMYFDCARKDKIFAVEAKTDHFRFFVDLDYKDTEEMDPDLLRNIVITLCAKVNEIVEHQRECVVKISEPKPCKEGTKSGVHLHWPDVVVNKMTAMAMRNHIVNHLMFEIPGYPWDKIIDIAVYKGSGLRLPWSWKKVTCSKCNGNGCPVCSGTGKVDEGAYVPLWSVNQGRFTELGDPTVEIFKKCSIRSNVKENFVLEEDVKVIKPKKEGGFSSDETSQSVGNTELNLEIQNFVQQNMGGHMFAKIKNVFKHKDHFLVKTDSRYCENIGRTHNSNHVWFLVKGDRIAQRCFCRCETTEGRKYGFCKDFTGREMYLSGKLVKMFSAMNSSSNVHSTSDSSDIVSDILSII